MASRSRPPLASLRLAGIGPGGDVVPLARLTAGTLTWPWQHAHRVLHEWRAWTAVGGADSAVRIVRSPRGGGVVAIDVAVPGPADAACERLAPLRRLEPVTDTIRPGAPALVRPAALRVPAGTEPVTLHRRLRALPAAAVDALATATGPDSRSRLVTVELRQVGGAYLLAAVGAATDAEDAERIRCGLADLERRMHRWLA